VPIPLLSRLFQGVIKNSLEGITQCDGNKDLSSMENDKDISHEVMENVVMDALLDNDTGIFSRYKVNSVDISSKLLLQDSDDDIHNKIISNTGNNHNTGGLPKRFTRKLMKPNDDDRSEIDRFLYGEELSFVDTIRNQTKNNGIKNQELIELKQREHEEIRMQTSLILYLQQHQPIQSTQNWILFFASILLETLGVQISANHCLESMLIAEEISSITIPHLKCEPSLSVVYALQNVNKFLLHSNLSKDLSGNSQVDFDSCVEHATEKGAAKPFKLVFNLLLDSNLVWRRISAMGAYLSVKEYVNEWQSLRHLQNLEVDSTAKTIYNNQQYSSIAERRSSLA
jgi:hypothetical protein